MKHIELHTGYDIDEKTGKVDQYEYEREKLVRGLIRSDMITETQANNILTTWQTKQIEINHLEDLYPENKGARFTTPIYLEFVKKTLDELQVLIKAKNSDYTNGAGPFANFDQASEFGVDPFKGLMVRMGDKMQRIKSYCSKGALQVANEGVEDALKDLIGYSLIGLAMLDEKKRGAS